MNLSEVITELKLQLGLMAITLPFKGADIFQFVIENITLKYFSLNQPYLEKIDFNLGHLTKKRQTVESTTYILPDVFNGRTILFVRDVQYSDVLVTGYSYYGAGTNISYGAARDNILMNAGMNLGSAMIPRMTFDFKAPRELTIFNAIQSSTICVEFAFMHNKNLASIEETCRDAFMEMAMLDMKVVLYNNLKHYNEIPSAFGSIQLKIDDWANAESERRELLRQWSELYILDVGMIEFI